MLTKSNYLKGEQCLRLLWFAHKKLMPPISESDQHRFDQGYLFEEQVHKLFPDGKNLKDLDFKENLEKTKTESGTLFEAGFLADNLYARADILNENLYEIKSTTEVKKQHIIDLAFQKHVIEKTRPIKKCFVIHLNKDYKKQGEIDPKKLTTIQDVTEEVELIEINTEEYEKILKLNEPPEINISSNCNKPYICPFKEECWGTLPKDNVLLLTNWRQYWKLFQNNIIELKDIDESLKPKDEIIKEAHLKNKKIISKEHIKHFLKTLKYPLYHFDFETFDTAVPIYDNSRPYQKIPFQYSLHIQHKDKIEHKEYLADGKQDPRIKLLKQLKNDLKGNGSIIVFNKSFEIMVLKQLMEDFNEPWIQDVIDRIVDLAVPFQNFHYYCPSQKGSYSIKKVLPAITGKGYDNLEINKGDIASVKFFNNFIKEKKKNPKLRKNLLEYCKLDTEGMVWIVNELEKIIQ